MSTEKRAIDESKSVGDLAGEAKKAFFNAFNFAKEHNKADNMIKNETYQIQREQTAKYGGHCYVEGGDNYKEPRQDHGKIPTFMDVAGSIGKTEVMNKEGPRGNVPREQLHQDARLEKEIKYYRENKSKEKK